MKSTSFAACLAVAFSFTLAGCGDAPDKQKAEAKPAAKPAADAKPTVKTDAEAKAKPEAKPEAQAKAPTAEAKPAAKAEGDAETEAGIKANLAKLSPEDRKLAEAQRFCAVQGEERLGSMGTPVKLMIKDKPVFLCCGSCKKRALAEADETLARAEELKAKSATTK
jgi:hypothetical protein